MGEAAAGEGRGEGGRGRGGEAVAGKGEGKQGRGVAAPGARTSNTSRSLGISHAVDYLTLAAPGPGRLRGTPC